LLGTSKVLLTKDRRESRRRKTEQPHPNTSLKELKETRDREKRYVLWLLQVCCPFMRSCLSGESFSSEYMAISRNQKEKRDTDV
jgi:hypothetical protein